MIFFKMRDFVGYGTKPSYSSRKFHSKFAEIFITEKKFIVIFQEESQRETLPIIFYRENHRNFYREEKLNSFTKKK